jgi:hypothetical protein
MRCPPITARLVRAPHRLAGSADVTELCRQIQHCPTGHDLIVDLSDVDQLEPDTVRTLRDHLLWRLHWTRVGVIADAQLSDSLSAMHLDGLLALGPTFADVAAAMAADQRTPPGGGLLVMGPGPASSRRPHRTHVVRTRTPPGGAIAGH